MIIFPSELTSLPCDITKESKDSLSIFNLMLYSKTHENSNNYCKLFYLENLYFLSSKILLNQQQYVCLSIQHIPERFSYCVMGGERTPTVAGIEPG